MNAPPAAPLSAAFFRPSELSDSPAVGSLRANAAPAPIPPPINAHTTRRFMPDRVPRTRRCQSGSGASRASLAWRLGARHECGVHLLEHDFTCDDALADVGSTRQVVHDVQQHLFEDGAQPACAGTSQQRLVGDGVEGIVAELQLDVFELEELAVLLDQRVLRFDEDADEGFLVEVRDGADDRQPTDELGNESELQEIFWQHLFEDGADVFLVRTTDVGAEPDALAAGPALDDLLDAGERTATDEQDVGGVDLDELLVRVLAPALRRHRCGRAFEDLQQRLLHAFA